MGRALAARTHPVPSAALGAAPAVGLAPGRAGQRCFPRWKKRGKARDGFRYTTGAYGPAGEAYVKLPRIGRVKVGEPMGALTARLADGRARRLGATVSRTADRWFVSFTIEVERDVPARPSRRQRTGGPVGVDLGVKHLAVLSTGQSVANPKHCQRAERKLRRASRAHARSKPGSAGRRQRAATLAQVQNRIADQRRDGLHKITTAYRSVSPLAFRDPQVSLLAEPVPRSGCPSSCRGRRVRAGSARRRSVAPGEFTATLLPRDRADGGLTLEHSFFLFESPSSSFITTSPANTRIRCGTRSTRRGPRGRRTADRQSSGRRRCPAPPPGRARMPRPRRGRWCSRRYPIPAWARATGPEPRCRSGYPAAICVTVFRSALTRYFTVTPALVPTTR